MAQANVDKQGNPFDLAAQAAEIIRERTGVEQHHVALTLGSGWAKAADLIGEETARIDAASLPGFIAPEVAGHVADDVGRQRRRDAGRGVAAGDEQAYETLTPYDKGGKQTQIPTTSSPFSLSLTFSHNATAQGWYSTMRSLSENQTKAAFHAETQRTLNDRYAQAATQVSQLSANQSKAAQWLGLNRNTLRKKLLEHKLID